MQHWLAKLALLALATEDQDLVVLAVVGHAKVDAALGLGEGSRNEATLSHGDPDFVLNVKQQHVVKHASLFVLASVCH